MENIADYDVDADCCECCDCTPQCHSRALPVVAALLVGVAAGVAVSYVYARHGQAARDRFAPLAHNAVSQVRAHLPHR